MSFPENFLFGAAAASYQIEGAVLEDGRGACVWHMHSHSQGKVFNDHNGDVACDHYHRYREDVALMKEIGLQAYRFSISWPRIRPEGIGRINEQGLAFYDRLVDTLLAAGIQPWATLFHWDYPYELYLRGGWLNPDSSKWFADYTAIMVEALSDRVTHWMTLNEPQVFIAMGHAGGHEMAGHHAPGLSLAPPEWLRAHHNVLLAHGRAVQTIRAHSKQPVQVGIVPAATVHYPASDRAEDIEAARKATFAVGTSPWNTSNYVDPIVFGHYPEDGLQAHGSHMPTIDPANLAIISQPIDFIGHNHYSGILTRAHPETGEPEVVTPPAGTPRTAFNWPVTPDSLYWSTRWMYERYKLPIVITENGLSSMDWVSLDGRVHDANRIDFLTRYLHAVHEAICDGADVRAYLQWSILDNFEWAAGYRERFGLIHVDYENQKRTLKDSAHWYREVIRTKAQNILADSASGETEAISLSSYS